jgi:hypothetical protein
MCVFWEHRTLRSGCVVRGYDDATWQQIIRWMFRSFAVISNQAFGLSGRIIPWG